MLGIWRPDGMSKSLVFRSDFQTVERTA